MNGGKFREAADLAAAVKHCWPAEHEGAHTLSARVASRCCSWIGHAIDALHAAGFEIAIETNGTLQAPAGIDWICVSPKAGATVMQLTGDELKLVYPQREAEAQPENFSKWSFKHFFLQPLDDTDKQANTRAAIDYCLRHPQWKLSLQTHKIIGID